MADAIGGVPVCVDANIHSRTRDGQGSGLKMKKGTHPVKGEQALQWLRTRYGFEDGTDLGRAKAQHMYMNSMVRELRENATLSNPNKLRKLAEEATEALTVDHGLGTVTKLYDLSERAEEGAAQAHHDDDDAHGALVQDRTGSCPRPGDADQLFRLVREDDLPLDGKRRRSKPPSRASNDPAATDDRIAVLVQNGTRVDGQAATPQRAGAIATVLQWQGLHAGWDGRPDDPLARTTVIRYPSADLEGDAQARRQGPRDAAEFGGEVDRRLRGHAHRRRRLAHR